MAYKRDKKITLGQLENAVQAINQKTAILKDFIDRAGLYIDDDGDLAQHTDTEEET